MFIDASNHGIKEIIIVTACGIKKIRVVAMVLKEIGVVTLH